MATQVTQKKILYDPTITQNTNLLADDFFNSTILRTNELAVYLIDSTKNLQLGLNKLVKKTDFSKYSHLTDEIEHETIQELVTEWNSFIKLVINTKASCDKLIEFMPKQTIVLKQEASKFFTSYNKAISHSWAGLLQRYENQDSNDSTFTALWKFATQKVSRYSSDILTSGTVAEIEKRTIEAFENSPKLTSLRSRSDSCISSSAHNELGSFELDDDDLEKGLESYQNDVENN